MDTTNPLLLWLRDQVADLDAWNTFSLGNPLCPFGSHALFGSGEDRDFMIDFLNVPKHLVGFILPATCDVNYAEPFHRIQDLEKGFDFLICEKRRVDEFAFAMQAMNFLQSDRPNEFLALRDNKPLRVATFRMARFCCPGSELVAGEMPNPDID